LLVDHEGRKVPREDIRHLFLQGVEWLSNHLLGLVERLAVVGEIVSPLALATLADVHDFLLRLQAHILGSEVVRSHLELADKSAVSGTGKIPDSLLGDVTDATADLRQYIQDHQVVQEVVESLSKDPAQHRLIFAVCELIEAEFLTERKFNTHADYVHTVAVIHAALKKIEIFKMMKTMRPAVNSQHFSANALDESDPTMHTAQAIYFWLQTARLRFPEVSLAFREELVATMKHDMGKLFNPKRDEHHKLSWMLAAPGVQFLLENFLSSPCTGDTDDKLYFLIDMHDVCGHIAAGRRKFFEVFEIFQEHEVPIEYMRALFYIQQADMNAIPGMNPKFKIQNIAVWLDLVTDLGYTDLVQAIQHAYPELCIQADAIKHKWLPRRHPKKQPA